MLSVCEPSLCSVAQDDPFLTSGALGYPGPVMGHNPCLLQGKNLLHFFKAALPMNSLLSQRPAADHKPR